DSMRLARESVAAKAPLVRKHKDTKTQRHKGAPRITDFNAALLCAFVSWCLCVSNMLHPRYCAGTIPELILLDSVVLQHRQMEILNRCAIRQYDMLPSQFRLSIPATHDDVRLRIVVMQIAVTHIRPIHEYGVIQQRSISFRSPRHLRHKLRELLH